MTAWSESEMSVLGAAPSLLLSAGAPGAASVEVGMVVVDGMLVVRSFRGPSSAWYDAAVRDGSGTITVAGSTTPVTFAHHDRDSDAIELAYATKYGSAAQLVASPAARAATIRIAPAEDR